MTKFLGNLKAPDYDLITVNLISDIESNDFLMRLNAHSLNKLLDLVPEILGHGIEELGQRLYQDIKEMEKRY